MKITMPITKAKIKNHFAYAWWQYAILAAVAIFGWNLLYTTTHYRSPAPLRVEWYCDSAVLEKQKDIDALMDEAHAAVLPDMEVVSFVPVSLDQTYGPMQLTVWMAAGEGDLFLLNKESFASMASGGGLIDLAPYIESGALNVGDIDLKKGYVTDSETGKSVLVGIPTDALPRLQEYGIFYENELFGVSINGGNIDNTLKLLDWVLQALR